ncbi:hypothetical protein [Rossellomorea aquimaris]|uniref:pPIWI-RE three-gene island domain-containing protein n=1 Tax=Rossellomorea aquimaris TaxID=189382 RepID=A0A1J6X4X1_9BACI|nr:hypothetical protein [Rossellomorea aquimaris]OIU73177.1 hypothetical protein BHE18_14970 [Rossellomorea aquimaris]
MFISLTALTSDLKKSFEDAVQNNSIPVNRVDLEVIIQVEFMIFGFQQNYGSDEKCATTENIWSILPNHRGALLPGKQEEVLDILRLYFSREFTLPTWRRLVDHYLSIQNSFRIYELHKKGYFYHKLAAVMPERHIEYGKLLTAESISAREPEDPVFIEKEDSHYYFLDTYRGRTERRMPYTQDNEKRFPPHLIQSQDKLHEERNRWILPSGRTKIPRKKLALSLHPDSWLSTAEEMDAFIKRNLNAYSDYDKKQLRRWIDAQSSFRLKPTASRMNEKLEYKDQTGIAGLVGAGKTTFLNLEVFRLKKLGVKSGIFTVNVVDTLMHVYRLHLVGIKAVPIIGKSSAKKHLKDFLRKVKNEANRSFEVNPLSQLSIEYVLQFFEGSCLAQVLSENWNHTGVNPCISIKKDGYENEDNRFACPLFTKCGKYTIERSLREADMWVGTLSAFISSKPRDIINPYKKTYAELAHDELDVIFVDEADSVQQMADTSFLTANKIFGEDEAVFEKNFLKVSHELATRYDYANSKHSHLWRIHSTEINHVHHLIFELIHESEFVRGRIKNRTFGIHQIMILITKFLYEIAPDQMLSDHPFFTLLKDIDFKMLRDSQKARDAYMERAIRSFVNQMHEQKSYDDLDFLSLKEIEKEETKKLLSVFLNSPSLQSLQRRHLSRDEQEEVLQLFRFFVYHLYFDYNFKFLIGIKKAVELLCNQTIEDLSGQYQNVKRYLPLLPEAATGREFQYYFKESNKAGAVGTFSTYDYLAIGRNFLTEFGTLFRNLTGKQGPAMCYMSGTSFAEGSNHYHVDVPLDFLLESTSEKVSTIKQFLYPVYKNGKPIYISGVRDEKQKKQNLREMAEQLVPKLKEELSLWHHDGRKVLIVVNSYEQANIVQSRLERYFPNKVRALAKQIDDEAITQKVLRAEVEFFADTEADILIVPLLSINRGYNILKQEESNSLFGSIFFLIRPYIPGDSITNIIQVINGAVPYYIEQANYKGLHFYEAIKYIRSRSNSLMQHMLLEDNEWSYLDVIERKNMAWYMFINVWQMIGRLLRGQTDARVFYVDAPFAAKHANGTGKKETLQSSMLRAWVSILEEQCSDNWAKQELYGEFLRGLKKALSMGG